MERIEAQGMVCPICRIDLVMGDRQGVEIDYCPKCRGVWLDRGELDKIVEKAVAAAQPTPQPQAASFLPQGNPAQAPWGPNAQSQPAYGQGHDQHDKRRHDGHDDHDDDHHGRRNRGGWLGGLMD